MASKLHLVTILKMVGKTLRKVIINLIVIYAILSPVIIVPSESAQDNQNNEIGSPIPTSPSSVTFSSDWTPGIEGPGNWLTLQAVASDRFQRVQIPNLPGRYAVRVEVRPGDDPIDATGERAEVAVMTDANGNRLYENESSGTQFYAFSVQLDASWTTPGTQCHWGSIFQLHGPDSIPASPAFAIAATNRFCVYMHSGDFDADAITPTYRFYELSKSSLNLGQWVEFVVKIKFAKDNTGSVDVWRRDEGEAIFSLVLSVTNVPTLLYKSSLGYVDNHYWKYGYYRPKQATITNILLLGGLARGTNFDDVVAAAFPPKLNKTIYIPQVFK